MEMARPRAVANHDAGALRLQCRQSRNFLLSRSSFPDDILIMTETHKGGCYCGAVEIEVGGEPLRWLLPLRKLPTLFRSAGERVHVVEA